LRQGTPAARSLPLLVALARRTASDVVLGYLTELQLAMSVTPIASGVSVQVHSMTAPQ
jgi:hypothetical protein